MKAFCPIRSVLALLLGAGLPLLAADQNPPANKAPPSAPSGDADESRGKSAASAQPAPGEKSPRARRDGAEPIDINTANRATLEAHPLIGRDAAKAIVAARPFASLDDLSRLQGISAERLEQIRMVAFIPAPMIESPAPDRSGPEHGKVDVNTADRATLEAIPAIGPDLAPVIIAARPFARIDDLDRIQGISAERLELVRNALTVATPKMETRQKSKRAPRSEERLGEPAAR